MNQLIAQDNPDDERNNILGSLFCAEPPLEGGALIVYSDILYASAVVEAARVSTAARGSRS